MITNQLLGFALIYSGFLKHFWMGSGHGTKGKNPKQRFTKSQEMALVGVRRIEMAVGSFRVWPKLPLCSGRGDLGMYSPQHIA
jgi:hypothetical protein